MPPCWQPLPPPPSASSSLPPSFSPANTKRKQQTISRVKEFIDNVQRLLEINEGESLLNDQHDNAKCDYTVFLRHIQRNLSSSKVHNHVIRLGTKAKKTQPKKNRTSAGRRRLTNDTPKNDTDKLELLVARIKEETETLFFIVVDEAHYGTTIGSDFNCHFNTP